MIFHRLLDHLSVVEGMKHFLYGNEVYKTEQTSKEAVYKASTV